jgi:hypothetical protein
MIKTVLGFACLLILALVGLLMLVGGAVMLVRLIRWLASMSHDDLERLYMTRQSLKRLPRKEKKRPAPLDWSSVARPRRKNRSIRPFWMLALLDFVFARNDS